jgi:dephospho-CoA kinase
MKRVGLTGGIGTGKTTVSKIFQRFGIPIFYADYEAKLIMNENIEVKKKLQDKFGNEIYNGNKLITKKLADIIFNNPEYLKFVNQTVHPEVMKKFYFWTLNYSNAPYIIMESAILFESGLTGKFEKIILIVAPVELCIKRIKQRDNSTDEEIKRRMQNQWDNAKKIEKADYVIYNDDEHLVINQVINIHNSLIGIK